MDLDVPTVRTVEVYGSEEQGALRRVRFVDSDAVLTSEDTNVVVLGSKTRTIQLPPIVTRGSGQTLMCQEVTIRSDNPITTHIVVSRQPDVLAMGATSTRLGAGGRCVFIGVNNLWHVLQ